MATSSTPEITITVSASNGHSVSVHAMASSSYLQGAEELRDELRHDAARAIDQYIALEEGYADSIRGYWNRVYTRRGKKAPYGDQESKEQSHGKE